MQPITKNPYEAMHIDDVRCSVDAVEEIKQELHDYVKTVAARNIEGFDVGEFSNYIDDVIHDTIDANLGLAENVIQDADQAA